MSRVRALAASARLANLPSVVSNLWLGIALAAWNHGLPLEAIGARVLWLMLSASGLYLAGTLWNDWADRAWDQVHRPERALPQGLWTPQTQLWLALSAGIIGLIGASRVNPGSMAVALAIGLSIVIYTHYHKRSGRAVLAMASCRALLPLLGFVGACPRIDGEISMAAVVLLPMMTAIFIQIAGLSWVARRESTDSRETSGLPSWGWFAMASGVLVGMAVWMSQLPWWPAVLGFLLHASWLRFSLNAGSIPLRVSRLLAGLPLLDLMVLWPLALALSAADPTGSVAVCSLMGPPVAWELACLLQRLAAAT